MNHLLSPVSLVGILSTAVVWHGHVLFDCRSPGFQVGFALRRS
jgi:hypothetical protein